MACFKAIKRSVLIGFLILTTVGRIPASSSPCPPEWIRWRHSCYIRLPEKMTWVAGSKVCNRPGISSLAVPNSHEENESILESVIGAEEDLWIGCTDAAEEGKWLCGDQPLGFNNWAFSFPSPDNRERNCAWMISNSGGQWSDVSCNATTDPKWVACEMSAFAIPVYHTSTGPDGRVSQRCLLHHDIRNLTVESLVACGWACRADIRCRSFNWQSGKRRKICQLNNAARSEADHADFNVTDNCYYFDL